jgi:hypothetical protein
MALVTKEDVKTYLNYDGDTNDSVIDSLIARYEADFKHFIGGVDFDATSTYTTYTEYFDGDGTNSLLLKRPIRSITSIHIDTDRNYGADTLVASTDYVYYSESGIVRLDYKVFSVGNQSVKVVYAAGYKTTDAPADFKQIIINEVVASLIEGLSGVNAIEANDFFYRPDKLRKEADSLKEKYREWVA